MDVRHAILSSLAALALTGCPSTWNCHPPSEEYAIDEPVSVELLDDIVFSYGLERSDEVTCAQVCSSAYRAASGWSTIEPDTCELTRPGEGEGEDGRIVCEGTGYEYFCKGRRPLGHVEDGDADCDDALGRNLAAMAYLEAASVHAFEELADALTQWGAPPQLVARCRNAAQDERHHARWLGALARARGGRVPTPRAARSTQTADLLAFARQNAVEGCVHETFAALLANYWGQHANHPTLRSVFARIATDETIHAQLAWDLHDWFQENLPPQHNAELDVAQREALAALPDRARELAAQTQLVCSLPPTRARALAVELGSRLAA